MNNKTLCLNINEDLYNKLNEKAKKNQLSITALIRLAIIEYLEK